MEREQISLPSELRRIARELDIGGLVGNYCCSKYDTDLIRDAAKRLEILSTVKQPDR